MNEDFITIENVAKEIKTFSLLIFLCLGQFCFSQVLIKKKTVDKGQITLTGIAYDGKWSGILISQDSVMYNLEDGVRWEEQFINKNVEVVGQLILEKRKYKVVKDDNEEIVYSAVLPERMLIIQSPTITQVEKYSDRKSPRFQVFFILILCKQHEIEA